MGLLYNNKKKTDLVILDEQELEKNEDKEYDFVLIPDADDSDDSEVEKNDCGKGKFIFKFNPLVVRLSVDCSS